MKEHKIEPIKYYSYELSDYVTDFYTNTNSVFFESNNNLIKEKAEEYKYSYNISGDLLENITKEIFINNKINNGFPFTPKKTVGEDINKYEYNVTTSSEVLGKYTINKNRTSKSESKSISIQYNKKPAQIIKLKRQLKNEEIIIGYTSKTEQILASLLKEEPNFAREVINELYLEMFNEPDHLVNIIEIMSNLDYKEMQPNNITMAMGTLNHKNIAVQEAAIASFEKWDDPHNLKYLESTEIASDWLREYTDNVIKYLKGC